MSILTSQVITVIRIGCQGWRYPDWRKTALVDPLAAPFYPATVPATAELTHYSKTFDLVEIDATFYAIPSPQTVAQWVEQTPAEFRFTLKLPRTLTHELRLRRGRQTLLDFCERAELMAGKLAAVLIQLPPSFGLDEFPVLERFLPHLPTTLPFAIEFRDERWLTLQTLELLLRHGVKLTLGSTPWLTTAKSLQLLPQIPADWLYVRIMGAKEGGISTFTHLQTDCEAELSQWATALTTYPGQAYVLIDNHYQGFSPGTVTLLKQKLGLPLQPFPRDHVEIQQLTLVF